MSRFSRLVPYAWRWLCKSNARWTDLLQAGRDTIAIRRQSRARVTALFFLAMTTLAPGSALAKCHIFRVWHYSKPQRCFTALAPLPVFHMKQTDAKPASRVPETFQQRIEIPIPDMLFEAAPDGDERLQGIAKLHALMDAR